MNPWEPITPVWSCGSLPARSPTTYRQVVEMLDVARNARYQPKPGATFCNIFLWDATKANGCEIPHWVYGHEHSANDVCDWLRHEGPANGWTSVDSGHARVRANAGFPTVAAWKNPSGPGHVAVVLPSPDDGPTRIAQAGRHNFFDEPITHGFGDLQPLFYTHD